MKKTIAIDIRLLGKKRTGDETVFFHLTKEVLALDKENEYRLLTDSDEPSTLALLQGRLDCIGQKNVQIVPLRGKNKFIWNLITLPLYLYRHAIDVYHTQYILPLSVPQRTKVVLHIHDVSFAAYPKLIGFFDRLFLWLFIPPSLKRANLVVTPSEFTKSEITKYYGTSRNKISVIHNALGEDFFPSLRDDVERVREKYTLPKNFILYVGTLQPRKNIPFLLKAFAILTKRLPDIKLVLVGGRKAHHYDRRIESVIKEENLEDKVIFPGYIEQNDLPSFVQAATVYAFPSLYEGFGIPLLEAMSQNVPIAASNIACLQEIAQDAALYFDPTTLASCEEKLYTLCTDEALRADLIAKGKERLSLFSWQKSAALLLEKYKHLE